MSPAGYSRVDTDTRPRTVCSGQSGGHTSHRDRQQSDMLWGNNGQQQIFFPRSHITFCLKLCLFQSGALSNDGGADQRPLHPADHHPGSPQQHDAQHRQPRGSGLQRDTWRSVTHCDHAMHNFKFWPFLKTKWLKPNVLHCIVTSTQCCDLCTQLVDWAENCCYCCGVQTSRDLSGGHWWPTLSLTSKLMFWLIQPLLSGRGTSSGS